MLLRWRTANGFTGYKQGRDDIFLVTFSRGKICAVNDRLAGKARGKCVTHFGWRTNILWAPRPQVQWKIVYSS